MIVRQQVNTQTQTERTEKLRLFGEVINMAVTDLRSGRTGGPQKPKKRSPVFDVVLDPAKRPSPDDLIGL